MSRLVGPGMAMGVTYMQFIFPGILGMTVLFSSIFSSISIIWDKEFGFMKEILVAPVSRFSIVIGKALSGTLISVIQAAIILALFPVLGIHLDVSAIVWTVLVSVLLSFCLSSFGIVIATFYESFESFSVIMNFIVMPMFFLSGAMYPVKMLPEILKIVARLNPFTYGIDALKHSVFGNLGVFDFSLLMDVSVLGITSVIFVAIAGSLFERKK
jgi:ABC-2 type transport system permease protein